MGWAKRVEGADCVARARRLGEALGCEYECLKMRLVVKMKRMLDEMVWWSEEEMVGRLLSRRRDFDTAAACPRASSTCTTPLYVPP